MMGNIEVKRSSSDQFLNRVMQKIHRQLVFGRRIDILSDYLLKCLPEKKSLKGLDVGCGTGELALLLQTKRKNIQFEGLEVMVRKNGTSIRVKQFDGQRLPYADNSFDFSMLIDVCHHTLEPEKLIEECMRVSSEFILVKDHYCQSRWDMMRLSFMDWFSNRAHNINMPYNYLSHAQWMELFERAGVRQSLSIDQLRLYFQPLSLIFDGTLHFIKKLEKNGY